jgi:divalent metal cation (Fe/Co/Zn/Cd) transporter
VAAGFRIADPIAGFAITLLIIHIGIDATKDVWSCLMDENDEEVAGAVRTVAQEVPGVVEVSNVRARWLGREVEAWVLVRLPAAVTFGQAHDVAHRVQEAVRARNPQTCAKCSWSRRRSPKMSKRRPSLQTRRDS